MGVEKYSALEERNIYRKELTNLLKAPEERNVLISKIKHKELH